jgi:hypothetical protein
MKTYKELKEVTFLNMYKSLKKYKKKNRKQKVCIDSLTKQLASANEEIKSTKLLLGWKWEQLEGKG